MTSHYPVMFIVFLALLTGCSSEQLRSNTYQAIHERELQQCREQGRLDCQRAERYSDYEKKRKEALEK